jgi:hypothetical protein
LANNQPQTYYGPVPRKGAPATALAAAIVQGIISTVFLTGLVIFTVVTQNGFLLVTAAAMLALSTLFLIINVARWYMRPPELRIMAKPPSKVLSDPSNTQPPGGKG